MKRFGFVWLLALLGACNGLLDLDPAHLDPSIAGGNAGSAAGGAPDGAAGAATEPPSLCARYCDAVMAACVDGRAQYTDLDACLTECAYFPEGSAGDNTGNTLNCRLNYALKAPSEPLTYCTWAGPGGDGMCGSNCEGFCTLMSACTAETTRGPDDYFVSNDECLANCEGLPSSGGYDANALSNTGHGDTYDCRLYHVGAAISAADSEVHCPHAVGRTLCVNK